MNNQTKLILVKIIHTIVWISLALIVLEGIVLLIFNKVIDFFAIKKPIFLRKSGFFIAKY